MNVVNEEFESVITQEVEAQLPSCMALLQALKDIDAELYFAMDKRIGEIKAAAISLSIAETVTQLLAGATAIAPWHVLSMAVDRPAGQP